MTSSDDRINLTDNARVVLENRYLMRDETGVVHETPQQLFHRVAGTVAQAERRYGRDDAAVAAMTEKFEDLMTRGVFMPNSPTLMNAGRRLGMLSACFVLPVEDTIEGIFESVKLTAIIQKAGGGTGFAFDRLRPTGDWVSSSGGQTSGPISFWRVFSEATNAIQQGAFRRGANMGMMSISHPDILKFIVAKRDLNSFLNFNISIKIPDSFMHELRGNGGSPHAVVNPRTGRSYHLPRSLPLDSYALADLRSPEEPCHDCYTRRQVWEMIVREAHSTGEPGLCFIDRMNADNPTPHMGRIEATNPCGEQPLLDYEACNLGSINLARFIDVRTRRFDFDAFAAAVADCVRFLDDVIDVNNYQIPAISEMCLGNRKIGLGVMGLADALILMSIPYDSEPAVEFGRQIARSLRSAAEKASAALASERGSFPNWPGSRWNVERNVPIRNAALTTVAPTGTISIIAGCSGGIEPLFSLVFERHILDGKHLLDTHPLFEQIAKEGGFHSAELMAHAARHGSIQGRDDVPESVRRLFVCARDIAPEWHVAMQAAFQESIDGAISKTINLPGWADVAEVDKICNMAYDAGCKGVTVYRDGCREDQPMALTAEEPARRICPNCRQEYLPIGCVRCPSCGVMLCG